MWSPHDPNLIATSSADFRLAVWNLATEQCVHSTFDVGTVPLQIDWCRHDPNLLVALCDTGRVVRWRLMYPRTVDRIDVGACERAWAVWMSVSVEVSLKSDAFVST